MHAQHIAILDDVMTTGSTAHELAYLLKKGEWAGWMSGYVPELDLLVLSNR